MKTPPLGRLRTHLPVAPLFAALSIASSFPLLLHLATHVPSVDGGPGDNLSFVWNLWWMRTALQAHANPFHTAYLFHPVGVDLTQHTYTVLNGAIAATLLAPLSPVTAQNVLLLVSLFLNGFVAYLLAFRLTANRFAAVAGGIAVGGAAPVLVRLHGHFNLVAAWVIPLAVLSCLRAFDRRSVGACFAAGAAFAAAAYSDYYYLVYALVLLAVLVADRWFDVAAGVAPRPPNAASKVALAALVLDVVLLVTIAVSSAGFSVRVGGLLVSLRTTFNERVAFWLLLGMWALTRWRISVAARVRHDATPAADLRALGLAGATFACLALPLIAGFARLVMAGDYTSPHYGWRSAPAGVDAAAFLVGSPLHPLYGPLSRRAYAAMGFNAMEGVGWVGLVAVAVLVVRWRDLREVRATRFWRIVVAVFGIWALGSHLDIFGINSGLILPGALLRFVPVISNARIPGRAMVIVALAVGMLFSVAVARLGARWSARRRAFVIALLLADVAAMPLPLYRPEASRVYSLVAQQPGPGAVLELPLGLRDGMGEIGLFDDRTLYFQTISGRPMLGGFVARLPDRVKSWYQAAPVVATLLKLSARTCPADWTPAALSPQESYKALERLSVRYVVLDHGLAGDRLLRYVASLPLRSLARDGARELYEVRRP